MPAKPPDEKAAEPERSMVVGSLRNAPRLTTRDGRLRRTSVGNGPPQFVASKAEVGAPKTPARERNPNLNVFASTVMTGRLLEKPPPRASAHTCVPSRPPRCTTPIVSARVSPVPCR